MPRRDSLRYILLSKKIMRHKIKYSKSGRHQLPSVFARGPLDTIAMYSCKKSNKPKFAITRGAMSQNRLLSVFAPQKCIEAPVAECLSPGIDIVPVNRFQKLVAKKTFLTRNFTVSEIEYCKKKHNSAVHFAGKFAAKEAVSKALKLEWKEGLNWKEIEIQNKVSGAPYAILQGHTKNIFTKKNFTKLEISISHCSEYAIAIAVVL